MTNRWPLLILGSLGQGQGGICVVRHFLFCFELCFLINIITVIIFYSIFISTSSSFSFFLCLHVFKMFMTSLLIMSSFLSYYQCFISSKREKWDSFGDNFSHVSFQDDPCRFLFMPSLLKLSWHIYVIFIFSFSFISLFSSYHSLSCH